MSEEDLRIAKDLEKQLHRGNQCIVLNGEKVRNHREQFENALKEKYPEPNRTSFVMRKK